MNSFIYEQHKLKICVFSLTVNINIMGIYEIGYWSHEEAPKILFTCDKDYTQEQFTDLVSDIIADIGVKEIEQYGEFFSKFEDLLEPVYFKLQEFGFKEIKSTVKLNPYGWSSLTDVDWKKDLPEDDDIYILSKKLRERLNYEI